MARTQRRQIGSYYLSKNARSDQWCRTVYDPKTRQAKRVSLGTADEDEAWELLVEWYQENIIQQPLNQRPEDVTIESAMTAYYLHHARFLPSATQTRYHVSYWTTFFKGDTIDTLTPLRQLEFTNWLSQGGLAGGTITRILAVGRAAFNRMRKAGTLTYAPYIAEVETAGQKRGKPAKGKPMSLDEMATLLDAAKTPHVLLFCILSIGTLARPGAVLDLERAQYDKENGVLDLNPQWRVQNLKKYRPTIKVAQSLRPWLELVESGAYVTYFGKRVLQMRSGMYKLVRTAKLDERINRYSFRHTMARELQKRRVPREEISLMLGHKVTDANDMTERYAPYHPDYCVNAVAAIDAYFADLQGKMNRRILGADGIAQTISSLNNIGWYPGGRMRLTEKGRELLSRAAAHDDREEEDEEEGEPTDDEELELLSTEG